MIRGNVAADKQSGTTLELWQKIMRIDFRVDYIFENQLHMLTNIKHI